MTGERENGYSVPETSTGTKIDAPNRDIPRSIQTIPRQVIEDRQIVRPDELTDNVSAVQRLVGLASSSGLGAALGYYIRGFYNYESGAMVFENLVF